jgi:nitric oxide dioxygenase
MITPEQKELIKATVPVLKEQGVTLTSHFYKRMFRQNPELKNTFNMGNQQSGKQQMALAMSVLAYAEHIEDPSVLLHAVSKIAHKHASVGIRPVQYAIVGKHLLASISEVLGEAATPQLMEAWAVAYHQLAEILTGAESNLYQNSVAKEGGWTGWRPFIVKHKIKESEEITSFYLYPADGGKVAHFYPGQYISVRLFLPELTLFQPRQYSLSNAPNGSYYRISVKKESGTNLRPDGMISNRLHEVIQEGDALELAPPFGDFTLNVEKENPVVFISGGVGQTPLISMLEYLISTGSKRGIVWIHESRNKAVHAFKDPVTEMSVKHGIKKHFFYDSIDDADEEEPYYEGIVELEKLKEEALLHNADYYVCDPAPFIKKQYHDLTSMVVEKEAIHFEEFGPGILILS